MVERRKAEAIAVKRRKNKEGISLSNKEKENDDSNTANNIDTD